MAPLRTTIALLLVLAAVLLAAGCENREYIQSNHDYMIGKISGDGKQSWILVINDSVDNIVNNVMETCDGKIAISGSIRHETCQPYKRACQNHQRMILLTNDGQILLSEEINESHSVSPIQNVRDNQTNTSSGSDDIQPRSDSDCYLSENPVAENLLSDTTWLKPENETKIATLRSAIRMEQNRGYIATGFATGEGKNDLYLFRIDSEGNVINRTYIVHAVLLSIPSITPLNEGYIIRFSKDSFNDGGYVYSNKTEIILDSDGNTVTTRNLDIPENFITSTDGHYVFMGFFKPNRPDRYADAMTFRSDIGQVSDAIHVVKQKPDGSIVWDTVILNATASRPVKIIQSSDGGYIFAANRNL